MPDLDNLLNWYFFRYLAQTKPNFLYELHINLGISHKDILGYYEGEKVLEFSVIKKICNHWSLPTKLFFDEKNLNLKDIDNMTKKKVKKIIPGIPDSELAPPIIPEGMEEGYPHLSIKCEAEIIIPKPDLEDPVKEVVEPHTYENNKAFFEDCKRLAASLEMDNKTKDEIKQEIFNLVCKKLIDKNRTFEMDKINPYYLKIVEALLA